MKHFAMMIAAAVTCGLSSPEIGRAAAATVSNDGGATNLSAGVTQLRGSCAADAGADVMIHWGTTDGGANAAKWEKSIVLKGVPTGSFSAAVSDLVFGLTYYYRCSVSNGSDTAWAPATTRFTTLPPQRPADLPVGTGLALWLDASQLTGLSDGAQVETWTDMSGQANHALRQSFSSSGYPRYATNQLNGLPVVQFDSGASMGDSFQFKRISNIRTVFWVLKEKAGASANHFLLGDSIAYHFHRGGTNGAMWDPLHSRPEIRKGTTRLMGTAVDGRKTALPAARYQLLSLVTAGNVQADMITQDRHFQGSWQGDIAEILIYTNALSIQDEALMGGYLAAKYGLNTAYPACPAYTSTSTLENSCATGYTSASVVLNATLACPGAVYDVRAYWGTEDGGTNAALWADSVPVGTWTNVSSVGVSKTVTGFTPNTTYYYTFRATNVVDDKWAANVLSFGPSPYKQILTFGTAGLTNAVISDNAITWTVPFPADVTALAPTYTVSTGATGTPVSGAARDFTAPQTYTVTAENGSAKSYTVTIARVAPRTEKSMRTFGLVPCNPALIFGTKITLTVPHATDVTALAPTYTVSAGARGQPVSGTRRDFSAPQTYTVSAEDGSRYSYTVTVAIADPLSNDILTFGLPGIPAVIAGTKITWAVPHGADVTALAPSYTLSDLASGYPYSGTVRDFTTPQAYAVSADDGATKTYVVTVTRTP